MSKSPICVATLVAIISIGTALGAAAQETAADRQPGMMRPGKMSPETTTMMQSGTMAGMPMMTAHGHMLKVMFAIADADGDGALSFEEVAAIHKRIFGKIDTSKDGKVTVEEFQAFMREK